MRLSEQISIFVVAGLIASVVCVLGYKMPVDEALIGSGIIVGTTIVGILLAKYLPGDLPMVFWVSVVAIFIASPMSPVAASVTKYVAKVDFLALCTVILSYAGLTEGKDIAMFRKMSWRIIVVALAVYTGTFLCATAIAQVMLHLEGLI